jgi:hypothetical protein
MAIEPKMFDNFIDLAFDTDSASEIFQKAANLAIMLDEGCRRQKQKERFDVYMDDYNYLIIALIKKQFHQDNADRLYPMVCNYANLLKKIVNLKSVIYKKAAKREWLSVNNEPVESYNDIISKSNINEAYQALNKYLNINNMSFMRVISDTRVKGIKYEAVPGENIVVLRRIDNPLEFDALLHHIVIDSRTKFWYYWDRYVSCKVSDGLDHVYDVQPNKYIDPNDTSEPRGIIPYVPVWGIQPLANSFWCETYNDDLFNATLQINVHLTHLNNLMKLACYKQIVFTGLTIGDLKSIYGHVTDGLNPITLTGEGANVTSLEMHSDINQAMSVIHDLISQVCDQHGVSFSSQVNSAQKQSGVALTIEREAMDDLREEQEPRLRECESKVAYITAIMANTDYNAGIDVNGTLRVVFGRDPVELTSENTAVEDWLFSKGIKSVLDLYTKMNPDIDPEQAEQGLRDNLAQNKELTQVDAGRQEITNEFKKRVTGEEVVEGEEVMVE